MKKGLVSIITPLYNNDRTIEETIQSVLNQTYCNWEHIIVDDGSSDNSPCCVRKYIETDTRIRYYVRNREPKGGSVCRNIGASYAKGEYLIFLDADDLLLNTCLENRVKLMNDNHNALFAVFSMASFETNIKEAILFSSLNKGNFLYLFIATECLWQITSPIWTINFFQELKGFNENYPRLQDPELHIRAIIQSKGDYIVDRTGVSDCFYRLAMKANRVDSLNVVVDAYLLHLKSMVTLIGFVPNKRKFHYAIDAAINLMLAFDANLNNNRRLDIQHCIDYLFNQNILSPKRIKQLSRINSTNDCHYKYNKAIENRENLLLKIEFPFPYFMICYNKLAIFRWKHHIKIALRKLNLYNK